MSEQRYPYFIDLYMGEGRILIIPLVDHIGGYRVENRYFISLNITSDYSTIGSAILKCISFISSSPISTILPKERNQLAVWKDNSKYKTWTSFFKNNYYALLRCFDDKHISVFSAQRSEKSKDIYDKCIKKIELKPYSTEIEIGKAIMDVFCASEEFHKENPKSNPFSKKLQLLDDCVMTFECPNDCRFIDSRDIGAAEIYQCYSYIPKNADESIAEFYFGIASELDCNLSPENIRNCWVELNGKADELKVENVEYGIFRVRAEMKNKSVHKISYFLQMADDLLLECSMEVHQPNKRKKTDEKLSNLFEQFALSCKK